MKFMFEYNEKGRYVMLCWKIWSWQVAGNDTVSVHQL